MTNKKKQYTEAFKFKVALAALKGDKTISTLCKEFGLHESQINRWKNTVKEGGSDLFNQRKQNIDKIEELNNQIKQLNEYIGEISVENKFLKKT